MWPWLQADVIVRWVIIGMNFGAFIKMFPTLSTHSWMVTLPGRGPLKSRRWAVLLTHWLIRFSSVFYMSVSRMPNLYQVLDSVYDVTVLAVCYSIARLFSVLFVLFLAPLTALVIFRDIGLIAAVFWVRYKTVPPPVRCITLHSKQADFESVSSI